MNAETGNSIWRLLHAYADQYPVNPSKDNADSAARILIVFGQVIRDRSYGCACQSMWDNILAKHPPMLESRESFQHWCIALHDRINQKLNRSLFRPEISSTHPIFTNP